MLTQLRINLKKQPKVDVQPLDIATSIDGKTIYILARGEILIYSINEGKFSKRFPIDNDFDKLTYAARNNVMILKSTSPKTIKIIKIDFIC
jgi:hypothetical protein